MLLSWPTCFVHVSKFVVVQGLKQRRQSGGLDGLRLVNSKNLLREVRTGALGGKGTWSDCGSGCRGRCRGHYGGHCGGLEVDLRQVTGLDPYLFLDQVLYQDVASLRATWAPEEALFLQSTSNYIIQNS